MKNTLKNNISKYLNRKMTPAETDHFWLKNRPFQEVLNQINIADDVIELIIEASLRRDFKHLGQSD